MRNFYTSALYQSLDINQRVSLKTFLLSCADPLHVLEWWVYLIQANGKNYILRLIQLTA